MFKILKNWSCTIFKKVISKSLAQDHNHWNWWFQHLHLLHAFFLSCSILTPKKLESISVMIAPSLHFGNGWDCRVESKFLRPDAKFCLNVKNLLFWAMNPEVGGVIALKLAKSWVGAKPRAMYLKLEISGVYSPSIPQVPEGLQVALSELNLNRLCLALFQSFLND